MKITLKTDQKSYVLAGGTAVNEEPTHISVTAERTLQSVKAIRAASVQTYMRAKSRTHTAKSSFSRKVRRDVRLRWNPQRLRPFKRITKGMLPIQRMKSTAENCTLMRDARQHPKFYE